MYSIASYLSEQKYPMFFSTLFYIHRSNVRLFGTSKDDTNVILKTFEPRYHTHSPTEITLQGSDCSNHRRPSDFPFFPRREVSALGSKVICVLLPRTIFPTSLLAMGTFLAAAALCGEGYPLVG